MLWLSANATAVRSVGAETEPRGIEMLTHSAEIFDRLRSGWSTELGAKRLGALEGDLRRIVVPERDEARRSARLLALMSDTNEIAKLDPGRTALLVMDYQPGIIGRLEDSDALLGRAQEAIAAARAAGATVGYVRVAFTDEDFDAMPDEAPMARIKAMPREAMHADSAATQVDERVAPADGDIVVRKTRVGPFLTTDLDEQLRARGVDTLLLAGISTSGVVLSTVRDAHDRDYRLYVLADATADPLPDVHAALIEKILPRQAEVIEVADLAELLG